MIVQAPEMRDRPRSMNANKLFDHIKTQYRIKSDAALAYKLGITPQVLCRVRSGDMKLSAAVILAVYDATEMSIEQIRELI